jgi:hypothetical protein
VINKNIKIVQFKVLLEVKIEQWYLNSNIFYLLAKLVMNDFGNKLIILIFT